MDTAVIEEEDWSEYMKRSTDEAIEQMKSTKNPVLDQNSQKNQMETGVENRTATDERWVVKAAEWNPELNTKYKTYRAVGRPKRSWEGKKPERWITLESEYARTAKERFVDNVLRRENPPRGPIRPARYLKGLKLDDDEVANI